jgi:hypothetical protein
MTREGTKHRGTRLVRQVFGGTLSQQGRGFYVSLELLAIVWGTLAANHPLLPFGSSDRRIRYCRRTHDFARRLLTEPDRLSDEDRRRLGPGADRVLGALLLGLVVPVPGQRSLNSMPTCHFFPYVGELVHYDAVWRGTKSRVALERNSYRGAGALVYRMLGDDNDELRLTRVRNGLAGLVEGDAGPLGTLASELTKRDAVRDPSGVPFDDEEGASSVTLESPWVDLLRDGVANIVSRTDVARARRVDAIVQWIPFCVAMHQLSRARITLGEDASAPLVFDCGSTRAQIRALAREHANAAFGTITRALERAAEDSPAAPGETDAKGWMKAPRTFFTTTLGSVGALNAMVGTRHFTLAPALLEAVVLATVVDDIEFDQFVEHTIHERLRIVVDGNAAASAGLLVRVDRHDFDVNRNALASTLRDLGLLREFSDMTKLVSTRTA